jgi:hypothetical protein
MQRCFSLFVALLCCWAVHSFSSPAAVHKELHSCHAVLRQRRLRYAPTRARASTVVMSAGLIDSLTAATVILADTLKEVPGLGVPAVPQNTYVPSESVDNFPQIVAGSLSGLLVYLWAAYEFGSVSPLTYTSWRIKFATPAAMLTCNAHFLEFVLSVRFSIVTCI